MRGSDLVSEFLEKMDLPAVFGVSGANCEAVFESLLGTGKTKVFLSKSEYGATTMAIGHYLATHKIGVVVTTSGPGILNTIPVLAEAYVSRIPVVVIAGSVPLSMEGKGAFQDTSGLNESLNLIQMLEACTCFVKKIIEEKCFAEILQSAFEKSRRHKRPVVIILPKNIAEEEVFTVYDFINRFAEVVKEEEEVRFEELKSFCAEAERPLILLGDDSLHLKKKKLPFELAEKMNARIVVTPNAKGAVDHHSSLFAGVIGIMGHRQAIDEFQLATHVLMIGFQETALSLIGIKEIYEQKKKMNLSSESVMERLWSELKVAEKKVSPERPKLPMRNGFSPENILAVIQKHLAKDLNIFVDAGNSGAWVVHYFKCSGNGLFYISLGMGGMGNSIGAAIGAAAMKGKRSIVFVGDGSFLFQGLEIHTALQYSLPVTFFVMNNNAHEMCATRERLFLKGEKGHNRFKSSFFAAGILKMFPGIPAREINSIEDLEECLNDFRSVRGPVVISLNLTQSDNPPFLTFKGGQA